MLAGKPDCGAAEEVEHAPAAGAQAPPGRWVGGIDQHVCSTVAARFLVKLCLCAVRRQLLAESFAVLTCLLGPACHAAGSGAASSSPLVLQLLMLQPLLISVQFQDLRFLLL